MIRNYFKIAIRNFWRNKVFSSINMLGLSIGIASCLIIMLFVQHELSYDRYNEKADRIVRVALQGATMGEKLNEAHVMAPVAATLKREFPEVTMATRLRNMGTPRLVYEDKSFREDAFAFVDTNFFQVFSLPLLQGDPRTALLEPQSVIISTDLAKKYFGNAPAMGKIIHVKENQNAGYKVTGIIDKVPLTSHFHFELFASMLGLPEANSSSWMNSNFFTYLLLQKGTDRQKLEDKLPGIVEKYIAPEMGREMNITYSEFKKNGNFLRFYLQPLTAIHLHSEATQDLSAGGDIRYVYIFGAIALFMLLIACINFMNLSTASASKRSREVGIRKVLGSLRNQLVRQFLLESILLTLLAMGLAIVFIYMALPLFNQLASQQLSFRPGDHPFLIPALLCFVLVTGVFAGSYPAFYLSSFKPVAVLKGKFTSGKRSIGLRSGLVVFQFFISITLMVSTAVVYNQLSYIQNKKLGYNKESVLVIPNSYMLEQNEDIFRQQLKKDPRILSLSSSGYLPAGPSYNNNFFVYPEQNKTQLVKTLRYDVDENYITTLGIHLKTGRNFSPEYLTDSSAVLLNETAASTFGWNDNAIGHSISTTDHGTVFTYRVIGVVKDFHFKSLHELISPLVMVLNKQSGTLIAKVSPKNVSGLLTDIQSRWKALGATEPIQYNFMEDRINDSYSSEQKTATIIGIFAGLTIFVACLGLFGLAAFTAEQRNKEIGIRKVLGCSVTGIVGLLSKDFLKLVLIAFVIASPIAWYLMQRWLQDFAYRINMNGWIFALVALLTLLITLLTVSFQAIKTALTNPVKTLRSE